MPSTTLTSTNVSSAQIENKIDLSKSTKKRHIFVCQLHDGRYVIGTSTHPTQRIAALNSGANPAVPKTLQINRLIGIKPVTEDRNMITTAKRYINKYGADRVICI